MSPHPLSRRPSRRQVLGGLAAAGAGLLSWRAAPAFALPEDRIKSIRHYSNAGDANGRQRQPMVNQSTNVVLIETRRGLVGIGEGGEPTDDGRVRQHANRAGPFPH